MPGIETEHYTGIAKATKHFEGVSSPRHSDLMTSTLHLSVHRQPKVTFRESGELIIYHSYHTQVASVIRYKNLHGPDISHNFRSKIITGFPSNQNKV